MKMKDWVKKLDAFLEFNERDILQDNGKASHEAAETFAFGEYEKYRVAQDREYISDFDREVKKLSLSSRATTRDAVKNRKKKI